MLFSGVAVAATGLAVSTGVLAQPADTGPANAALRAAPRLDADEPTASSAPSGQALQGRDRPVSRSAGRDGSDARVDPDKVASLDRSSGGQATRTEDLSDADPRDIARAMLPDFGFPEDQFGCLDALYVSESDWDPTADNPISSAYGIPQALTETHDDLPSDYRTNPASQIEWGLDYIRSSYGTPCSAWEFKQANNWY